MMTLLMYSMLSLCIKALLSSALVGAKSTLAVLHGEFLVLATQQQRYRLENLAERFLAEDTLAAQRGVADVDTVDDTLQLYRLLLILGVMQAVELGITRVFWVLIEHQVLQSEHLRKERTLHS